MTLPDQTHAPPARVASLDALRGLAALAVVLHHAWLLGAFVPASRWAWRFARYTPLDVVVEGRFPVILFFVLSGFVLTQALDRPGAGAGFAARRVARIWLPFAAALLLSAALCAALRADAPAWTSPWFAQLWTGAPDAAGLAKRLLLPAARREDLDPVVWSLAHELRISLVFPVLLAAARRDLRLVLGGALAAHVLVLAAWPGFAPEGECASVLRCRPIWGGSVAGSFALTAYFVLPFAVGIAVALAPRHQPWRRARIGLPVVAATLWAMNGAVVSSDLLFTAGAAVLVAAAAGARGGLLAWGGARWLGRLSYSLYLVHPLVFLAVGHAAGTAMPKMLVAVAVSASIAAAWAFHAAVEAPALRLSRRMGPRAARLEPMPLA